MTTRTNSRLILAGALILFAVGCKPKAPVAPPPPPPPKPEVVETKPPPPPVAIDSFAADPSSIQRGQSATLRWSVRNSESVSVEPGIGTVAASGSRQVYPNDSTTYTIRATGPGGPVSRTARVTVTELPPPAPLPVKPKPPQETAQQMLERLVQDVYFDYDKYDIREDARSQLTRNADGIKTITQRFPGAVLTIEGHCDERGSAEYNLGLGDRRSTSTKDFLVQLGVASDKLRTISYGKERPQCTDSSEGCWQRNRRGHFSVQ